MNEPCRRREAPERDESPGTSDVLGALRSAFETDPRPGLLFGQGRLVSLNGAGRRLLRPGPAADRLLANIRECLLTGTVPPNARFLSDGGEFALEFHPARTRSFLEPRVCVLVPLRRLAADITTRLSPRELDVVRWLSLGLTNAQIASRLGISVETARKHVVSILSKTRARNRTELVGMALSGRTQHHCLERRMMRLLPCEGGSGHARVFPEQRGATAIGRLIRFRKRGVGRRSRADICG